MIPIPCKTESLFRSARTCNRSALTLLELMMVLVILAIVSTVAIQSLQPQVENQRFQSATRLLSEIEAATIGPRQKYQLDGTPLINGFVADIGRLPKLAPTAVSSDPAAPEEKPGMAELWDASTNLAASFPFRFRSGPKQPKDYSDVRLACGWRGPYLHLAAGTQSLRDPWGQLPGCTLDEEGQTRTVEIAMPPLNDQPPEVLVADLTTGKVQVTGKIVVDDPQKTNIEVVALVPSPESSLTTLTVLDDEDEQDDTFLFSDVPVGVRAIVAEVNGTRQVKYVLVPHGGLNVVMEIDTETSAPSDSPENDDTD